MDVCVALEHRFSMTPDGRVWSPGTFAHSFWERYLAVFDRVRIVARARPVNEPPEGWRRADGDSVLIAALPYYVGPWQYLVRAHRFRQAVAAAVGARDAVILRVASQVATTLIPTLRARSQPYGVEVVADPYDVFAPGSVRHPLRVYCRWSWPRSLRQQCVEACGCAYVTQQALQQRYPPRPGAWVTHYSSVELPPSAFVAAPRTFQPSVRRPFRLITVGTLAQLYKAPDVLIDAVAGGVRDGLDLKLVLVGDGKHRAELEQRAAAQGLGARVEFRGHLFDRADVQSALDASDLFVLPSHQEGLPRAMIEAMARALPCIGSTVGGIPELLPAQDLVPPGDATALQAKIREVVTDPARLELMSARNLDQARAYQEDDLRQRRVAFYRHVRERTLSDKI